MSKKWTFLLILLIILAVAVAYIVKNGQNKSPEEVVKEISPVSGSIQNVISTTGVVQPQNRLEIKPPINGRIEGILVKEGDKVEVGQTLAWMSSTERAALLDAARSQGKETLDYWQQVYKPTPLVAPIAGEVIVRAVEPGQSATSSDAVIVLSDRLIIEAQVDETDIGKVKPGQLAMISLDAYPKVKVKAKIDHISYEYDIVNNVTIYEVDVLPETVPEVFRSGMSASVDIIEQGKDNILLIPLEAVKQDKQGSFVLLSQGKGKGAIQRRVTLGISDGNNVEVVSGLEPEDKIIIKTKAYLLEEDQSAGGNPFMPFGRRRR